MKKVIAASVIAFLLAGTSFAGVGDIIQAQEWGIGLDSLVTFTQGAGSSSTNQNLGLVNNQSAANTGLATQACQFAIGKVSQVGTVAGNQIVGSVQQKLGLDASLKNGFGQTQNITPTCGQIAQGQGVALSGTQLLIKSGGPGSVDGTNTAGTVMKESGGNICSNMSAVSALSGDQTSQVQGGACATGVVSTSMTAATAQIQQVD